MDILTVNACTALYSATPNNRKIENGTNAAILLTAINASV